MMNRSDSEWAFQSFLQEEAHVAAVSHHSHQSSSSADNKNDSAVDIKSGSNTTTTTTAHYHNHNHHHHHHPQKLNVKKGGGKSDTTAASFSGAAAAAPQNIPVESEEYQAFLKSKLNLACAAVASRASFGKPQDSLAGTDSGSQASNTSQSGSQAPFKADRQFPHYERPVVVFGKDRATCSMAESATDALDHLGLKNEESDTSSFTQPLSTPSTVASASSDPNTVQTSKRKRKMNVSSIAADIINVFEKSMERASADIAKLTEAITGGDALTRLGVELEGMSLDRMQVIRVAMYFGNKPNQLRIWNGLNDSYKPDFVKAILEE